jgi:two-component system, NtrC family, response regulator
MPQTKLLIVEPDAAIRGQLERALRERYALTFADTRRKAVAAAKDGQPDVVSLDLALGAPDEAFRILEELLRVAPLARIIVLGANGNRSDAQRASQSGAAGYLSRPLDLVEYEMVLKRIAYIGDVEADAGKQASAAETGFGLNPIIGNTPGMRDVFSTVSLVAKTDATVLIQGESGTGKELLGRAIHQESRRRSAPFVPINCGAIPEGLLEAELFGHEKGAYTGAHVQRKGKLELADTGTVFLDEIAELTLPLQVKVLRFLQEREVERVGGRHRIPINARVIAASNKDLKSEVANGRLREDLYFRLSVVTIMLPPLRDRGEDIGLLAHEFLSRNCRLYDRQLRFSHAALDAIVRYHWPGNIRELENAVHRAVILTRGRFIEPSDLSIAAEPADRVSLREARNRVERQVVVEALTRSNGNISRAAIELGISRPTMHGLLNKHDIRGKGTALGRRRISGVPATADCSGSDGAQ